jgi:cytochrome P450
MVSRQSHTNHARTFADISLVAGPIVRISPYELHVNDPDFYEELYAAGGKKRNKYAWSIRLFGQTDGSIATVDHDLHRLRRVAISPFFSKTNVRKLEPIIHSNISKLMGRMYQLEQTGQPVNLNTMYSAFTSDIILEYAFGESHHYLDKHDFNVDFFGMMDSIHHIGAAAKQFGWLLPILLSVPEFISTRVDKGMAAFAKMQNVSSFPKEMLHK